jgi:hypothetical protein
MANSTHAAKNRAVARLFALFVKLLAKMVN